ncbi:cytochrome b/b6 domain-containing protein [Roseospira visakhapatnamensis]|uniref:Cytochrome b n=1 Tax=Roseospira visakhapatnamensis TaxID=390880 RepID=A0A7W6RCC3_9PROT|nr:cytochrome b/b6 domain-containing protein [Roseospira visakhapatnamensis]MBB4265900.1 cytochrome b [Roseospira visakhapatnamensis]
MTEYAQPPAVAESTSTPADRIQVWDPLVRIGHWVLVAAFAVAYLTEGEPEWLHTWAGYAIVATLLLRVVWGVIGPDHARFASFVRGPGTALAYLRDEMRGTARRTLGHNPAGGLMAVALLVCLAGTTGTGMALLAEGGEGPLAPFMGPAATAPSMVIGPALADEDGWEHAGTAASESEAAERWEEWHEVFANLTLALIALHVLGAIGSSLVHRENLVRAMIDGRKRP